MISKQTAIDIAMCYREIETATELLAKVETQISNKGCKEDVRDVFGRPVGGLTLGVPSGPNSSTLYHVEWAIAAPVIRGHIAAQRAQLEALQLLALAESGIDAPRADGAALTGIGIIGQAP